MILTQLYNQLQVKVYQNRTIMGKAAAADFAQRLRILLDKQAEVRLVFAAAPSQNDFLHHLLQQKAIDWPGVVAFHMDEYLGLPADSPQSFQTFLKKRLFDHLPFKAVHYLDGQAKNTTLASQQYEQLLQAAPIDMIALGIGENGHLAFNDPPVADFADPAWVKVVALDDICRQQQVNDGAFKILAEVPTHAITLTIPALMSGRFLYGIVPGERKASAVHRTLHGPITTACPASILRKHARAVLYLDELAYAV